MTVTLAVELWAIVATVTFAAFTYCVPPVTCSYAVASAPATTTFPSLSNAMEEVYPWYDESPSPSVSGKNAARIGEPQWTPSELSTTHWEYSPERSGEPHPHGTLEL